MIENRYSILVADDEQPARERLISLLSSLREELPIGEIREASDGMEAFSLLCPVGENDKSFSPDIAFLDIRMPFMSGLELAHHLSKMKKPPLIIFATAHDEHAVEAFDAQAIDYILKPARKERVKESFSKIALAAEKAIRFPAKSLESAGMGTRAHLSVSERGKIRLIPVDDILYLKAELKYTTIRTKEKEFLTEEPLITLETEFQNRFVRIHRNCLVPKSKLRGFERNRQEESGWLALIDGCQEKLPVSRRQWSQIRELKLF